MFQILDVTCLQVLRLTRLSKTMPNVLFCNCKIYADLVTNDGSFTLHSICTVLTNGVLLLLSEIKTYNYY